MKTLQIALLIINLNFFIVSQDFDLPCGSSFTEVTKEISQRGGKYITASGELKILVVFAKFKNDISPNQFWPADSYPTEMNDFIDPDLSTNSSHYLNLTNYYNQMSFGNFKVTGRSIGVETPYPIDHYIMDSSAFPNRGIANKDILQVVDDSINYRDFDNWNYISDYNHLNEPDNVVDLILVIWRGLVFSDKWSGEATLGGGCELLVENNQKKIRMCFGGNAGNGCNGSGVTVQYWGERSRERNFKICVHEIAHWLIGGDHPYNNFDHTFWGMLTLGGEGICINSFEREKLAWLNPFPIEETILGAPISDYVTTPSTYKYHPENGYIGETFYFENHQRLSIYDDVSSNTDDKGIFILHIANGFYVGDCARIVTSDGFWKWSSSQLSNCWENDLPLFKKKNIDRRGYGNRDKIFIENTYPEFLYAYLKENNEVECNDWLHGYGFKNSFDTSFNDVFSSWSNPPALTCSGQATDFLMEVTNQSGSIITARFAVHNSVGGKPSKPVLGLDPTKESLQYTDGFIYLAWGADVWDSLPIEPDIDFSELQMNIDSTEFFTVYSGGNRFWSDSTLNYDSTGNRIVVFRVRVRDSQNKWSIWSKPITVKINDQSFTSIPELTNNLNTFQLFQNYPNPYNPSTRIRYQVANISHVSLVVYDVLGNEIETLVNEEKPAGSYEVLFNSHSGSSGNKELSSGVYFYKLQAGSFVETKKMILVK